MSLCQNRLQEERQVQSGALALCTGVADLGLTSGNNGGATTLSVSLQNRHVHLRACLILRSGSVECLVKIRHCGRAVCLSLMYCSLTVRFLRKILCVLRLNMTPEYPTKPPKCKTC